VKNSTMTDAEQDLCTQNDECIGKASTIEDEEPKLNRKSAASMSSTGTQFGVQYLAEGYSIA
jgi:hypothetical protein